MSSFDDADPLVSITPPAQPPEVIPIKDVLMQITTDWSSLDSIQATLRMLKLNKQWAPDSLRVVLVCGLDYHPQEVLTGLIEAVHEEEDDVPEKSS